MREWPLGSIITQVTYVHTGFGQVRPLCQSYFNMLLDVFKVFLLF